MARKHERNTPDFLCIGAQRSGSTWLYRMFREHDQIWMPPIKELHYFDELRVQSYFCKRFKGHLRVRWRANKKALTSGERLDLFWDLKLLMWPRPDRWYSSLFPAKNGVMAGEITPAYSTLQSEMIANVRQINPGLKIIFLMRDPIERSWSQARKDLPRVYRKPIGEIPADKVIEWFHLHWCMLRSDYAGTLGRWLQYFPREQIFLGFFEDVCNKPQDLLYQIYTFLGIDSSTKDEGQLVNEAVNVGTRANLSRKYELELAKIHEPRLAKLTEFVQGPAILWHERCQKILEESALADAAQTQI